MSSVATHLGIERDEYDARIRTFVPYYEDMLRVVRGAVDLFTHNTPTIVDLGIGTGALAETCLSVRPGAALIGIDADPAMLEQARARLGNYGNVELRLSDFSQVDLPPCDAIVASLALHHVPAPEAKRALFRRCYGQLHMGGVLLSADCYVARDPKLLEHGRQQWLHHLERTYPSAEAAHFLDAWAVEDTYFPLADEVDWLVDAGFAADVLWRADSFAVIAARKPDR